MEGLTIEATQTGDNLGRLWGMTMILSAMGGSVERIELKPVDGDRFAVVLHGEVPTGQLDRITRIATKQLGDEVKVFSTGFA